MKFKEIKPGMVIHCPTKEDLCELLKHLTDLGYRGHGCIIKGKYSGEWCICILENKKVKYVSIDDEAGYTITEFSDLIEPDEQIVEVNKMADDSPITVDEQVLIFALAKAISDGQIINAEDDE